MGVANSYLATLSVNLVFDNLSVLRPLTGISRPGKQNPYSFRDFFNAWE